LLAYRAFRKYDYLRRRLLHAVNTRFRSGEKNTTNKEAPEKSVEFSNQTSILSE
jgi:hypothetical protein